MYTKIAPYGRKVQYYETDRMGIVHHSNYIRWMEEARIDFLGQIGLPYDEIEKRGILIPVLSACAEYQKPFRFGDEFQIRLRLTAFSGLKFTIEYAIFLAETGQQHAAGVTKHGFLDESLAPVRLKKHFPDIYQKMLTQLDKT